MSKYEYHVFSGNRRVIAFRNKQRAEAYCKEWALKAGRFDLYVIENLVEEL